MARPILKAAKAELVAANRALEAMRQASNGPAIRDAWSDLVDHLEKCWNKAKLEASPTAGPLRKLFNEAAAARKNDELLVYLSQARHADQHSIQIVAAYQVGGMLEVPPGGEFEINLMAGTIQATRGEIKMTRFPPTPILREFTNRGRVFQLPTLHRGVSLVSGTPVEVAEHGVQYYETLVHSIVDLLVSGRSKT